MNDEIEKITPLNYIIKIRPEKMTFSIFKNNQPEVFYGSSGKGSIVNKIYHIIFFGDSFNLDHFNDNLNYVRNANNRLIIPYKSRFTNEISNVNLAFKSNCDLLPVVVKHFTKMDDLITYLYNSNKNNFLVVNEDLERRDLITIKLRFQKLPIYIIKNKLIHSEKKIDEELSIEDNEVIDYSKIRAKDTVNETNINVLSKNPVFLCRIHLRNLELDKVKQILFDFQLTSDDCLFIKTFLETMIKKENDEKINSLKPQLRTLCSAFETYPHIFTLDEEYMHALFDGDIDKELASLLWMLILSAKELNKDKNNDIIFWEWEDAINKFIN